MKVFSESDTFRFVPEIINPDFFNALSDIFTKSSNTLKQFVGNLSRNCLSLFDHFVGLGLKGLISKFIH